MATASARGQSSADLSRRSAAKSIRASSARQLIPSLGRRWRGGADGTRTDQQLVRDLPVGQTWHGSPSQRLVPARGSPGTSTYRRKSVSFVQPVGEQNTAPKTARSRRSSRHGRHTGEHVVAAARAIYNQAIADGLIDHKASPTHRVMKRRRLPNTRRALTVWELDQINTTARISGNDAILDSLTPPAPYRDRLPPRRCTRHPTPGPGHGTLPGQAARERQHRPAATHNPSPHQLLDRPQRSPRRGAPHRPATQLPQRPPKPPSSVSAWCGYRPASSSTLRAAR